MNVLMLLYKDIHYDARVQREALALAEEGHYIKIICIREFESEPPVLHPNIQVKRLTLTSKMAKVKVINQNASNQSQNKKFIHFKRILLRVIRNPQIKLIKDYLSYYEFYLKLKRMFRNQREQFDIIHCHDLNTLWQGYLFKKTLCPHAKLIYDSHELFNEMAGRNKLDKRAGYIVEGKLIRKIDCLISVNDHMINFFNKRYNNSPSFVVQNIPIYSEENIVNEGIGRNYFQSTFNLDKEDIILLYQGGINPHRGIEECILSLKHLPRNFKLILLGEGRIIKDLENVIISEGLQDRVFFHPQVPSKEVLWYTNQANIGLVMYRNTSLNNFYSTPNKVFEYLQAGIPTVASDHPGKSYIVEEYQTGICTKEDPQSIAHAIIKVSEKYDFYKDNCLAIRGEFTWENEKKSLTSLYTHLIRST